VRKFVWMVRVGFLIVSAGLLVAAIHVRRDSEAEGGVELRRVAGVTGQRQAIEFRVDEHGRPRSFATVLYAQCPGAEEQRGAWTPGDGAPVPFRWRAGRLTVRESRSFEYEDGSHGSVLATMRARVTTDGLAGRMRSRWRFERDGREYAVCDTGHVSFAVGPGARERLTEIGGTVYPVKPALELPMSAARARFAGALDYACGWTWQATRRAERRAVRRGVGGWLAPKG
jgi:hypothetical protein